MDPILQELLVGLVSNGLSEIVAHGESPDKRDSGNAVDAAVKDAVRQLTDIEAILPVLGGEQLREFLRSAEAHNAIRQIFASASTKELDTVESEFYQLWLRRTSGSESARTEVDRLFRSLVDLCQRSLDRAIASGNLTAIEARSAQRHAELRGAINSLNRSVGTLASAHALDIAEIDGYAVKYRRQIAMREGTITPPALDSARQVPIDSLYVPGRLEAVDTSGAAAMGYDHFGQTLFRRVVLGNPGSGKSTLAKKLAADLARDQLSLGHRPSGIVPFLVVLRDFGAHKREVRCSIVDFISTTSNSRYQLAPPPGAIEYLLLTGRAMVIFDGLDELLDTSYRAEISGDVESFANLYPAIPILVTSREVGYQQAPLSPDVFSAFRLASFSDPQIRQYAQNWFRLDKASSDADKQAEAFMQDSAVVSDLRSNALMLGLMCNLYKGSGYIPRNRPDVYEACAVMLFDRWDRLRQIGKPLNIESLLRPAMQHLAAWIYADPELQSGVTERDLIETTSSFLLNRRFEHEEDAELEARRFIELCRGRAWVFTDTGTTPTGERLYQFTHRTFLEFFTAGHLVRTHPTPEKLLKALQPHISVKEWDVVAQLAFQLLEHNVDGATDVLLSALTDCPDKADEETASNRLDFAVRSLEFLVPSPIVTRCLVAQGFEWLMQLLASGQGMSEGPASYTDQGSVDTVLAFLGANPENARPIQEGFLKKLGEYLYDPNVAIYAAELAINLPVGARRPRGSGNEDLAVVIKQQLVDEHRECLTTLAQDNQWIGVDLLMSGAIDMGDYVPHHGLGPLFQERAYTLFPGTRRVPFVEILLASLLQSYSGKLEKGDCFSALTSLAPYLTPSALSNVTVPDGGWLSRMARSEFDEAKADPYDLTSDQMYSAFILLAVLYENSLGARDLPGDIGRSSLGALLASILTARSNRDIGSVSSVIGHMSFSSYQGKIVTAWVQGSLSLHPHAVPDET